MDCSQPDSSVHGILQARILQWVAISFSRGTFPTQEPNPGILHCKQIFYHLSLWGSPKPHYPAHCNKLACQLTHPPAPRLLSVPPMTTGRAYTRTEKEHCLSSEQTTPLFSDNSWMFLPPFSNPFTSTFLYIRCLWPSWVKLTSELGSRFIFWPLKQQWLYYWLCKSG